MQGYLTRSAGYKAKDLLKALRQAFHDCETDFIQIAGREGLRDGTTAIVALVQDDTLTIAHVGDSRGVLCRADGKALALTMDHKPELPEEKRRIESEVHRHVTQRDPKFTNFLEYVVLPGRRAFVAVCFLAMESVRTAPF